MRISRSRVVSFLPPYSVLSRNMVLCGQALLLSHLGAELPGHRETFSFIEVHGFLFDLLGGGYFPLIN